MLIGEQGSQTAACFPALGRLFPGPQRVSPWLLRSPPEPHTPPRGEAGSCLPPWDGGRRARPFPPGSQVALS